jgi:hypothetical protein
MSATERQLDTPVRGTERSMRVAAVVAFALAAMGALLPGLVGRAAAIAVVAFIVAVPLLRVLSLGAHWLRMGDHRFAGVAFGLLIIVATGSVIAALSG